MGIEFDYAAKKTLALWSAKNNALIRKYEELLKILDQDEDKLYCHLPSLSRDVSLYSIDCKRNVYRMILDDLRKPCDLFISEFERVNHDEDVLSKELDIALSLDLKENGHV